MKMQNHSRLVGIILLCSITLGLTPGICISQEWRRNGKTDIYFLGYSNDKASTTALENGIRATLEFDKMAAGGLGVGFNINDHLNITYETSIGSAELKGKSGSLTIEGSTSFFSNILNIDINILKYRVTPFITGGIGYIRFDGDWEGVMFHESDFSYNAGGGLRWDVTNHFLIKALYRGTWTNLEDTEKSILFKGPEMVIGVIF